MSHKLPPSTPAQRANFAHLQQQRGLLAQRTGRQWWSQRTQARWDRFWAHPDVLQRLFDFLSAVTNYNSVSEYECQSCHSRFCPYVVRERKEQLAKCA